MGLESLWFAPPGLSSEVAGLLVFCSAMTSMLTATAGVGGGVLLFAIMAWVMPLTALIPVHGVVQIGSNVGRLLIMLRSVQLTILLPFIVGSALGGALGAAVVVQLPPTAMQIGLGAFILWTAWMKPPTFVVTHRTLTLVGVVVTFLTMFFGATAPLIASVLRLLRLDRLSLVATQSACVIAQHGVKVAAFGFLGFAFAPYLPLVAVMIGAGFIGTLIGNHVLQKIADQRFHVILSCVLTFLAVGLLAKGTSALIGGSRTSETDVAQLAVHNEHAQGQDHASLWEAANKRLKENLETTRSTLSFADLRTHELTQRTRRDRQRIAVLEKDFEAFQKRIHKLSNGANKLVALDPASIRQRVPSTTEIKNHLHVSIDHRGPSEVPRDPAVNR